MATRNTSGLARLMLAPSVLLLLVWMIVPLAMTLWFSFQNYNLLNPANVSFAGLFNYQFFYTDPAFFQSIWNTLLIVGVSCSLLSSAALPSRCCLIRRFWTRYRPHPRHFAIFRDATGRRTGLEEHDHASWLRGTC